MYGMEVQNYMPFTCRIANTLEDLDHVYRLRHECYLRNGSIEAQPEGRFHDKYDQLPNSFSFLLEQDGEMPVATVRISVVRPDLGWVTSPANAVFGDHAAFTNLQGHSWVEASRLCFSEQARRDVLMRLVANMAAMADFYEVDYFVGCPRVEHTELYMRWFGFEQLAPPRQYYGVSFQTALLGVTRPGLHLHTQHVKVMQQARRDAFEHISRM